jgi:hypothetical protein
VLAKTAVYRGAPRPGAGLTVDAATVRELLGNPRIVLTPVQRTDLLAGGIDPRVLATLAAIGRHHMSSERAGSERLPYLLRALKAPRILDRLQATAERARAEGWPYEQFLQALCEAEVFAREASGARQRIRSAGFPAPKTLEDFDFAAQPGAERPLILHLAQFAWIEEAANVCLIGPPDPGSHCPPGRGHWSISPSVPPDT